MKHPHEPDWQIPLGSTPPGKRGMVCTIVERSRRSAG